MKQSIIITILAALALGLAPLMAFDALLLAAANIGTVGAADLSAVASAKADAPKITHEWPAYYGSDGTYTDLTRVPILGDLSQAVLVWVSEHPDLGYGKTSSGGGHSYGPSHPSGSTDPIVYKGLVIQGYFNPKNNVFADDILLALDAATGQTKWKQVYEGEGYNRSARKHVQYAPTPVAGDGRVFFLGSGGRLHCVEAAAGKRVWDRDVEDFPARFKASVSNVAVKAEMDVKDGVSGVLGPVGLAGAMRTPLTVIGGVLIVSDARWYYAFDPATGRDMWKIEGGRMPSPVKLNGTEYALGATAGKVRLIEPRTGKVLWTEKLGDAGTAEGIPTDLVADGRIFVPCTNAAGKAVLTAFALSETGAKPVWQTSTEFFAGYFAYRDGIVYYNMPARRIQTYRADNGALLHDFACGGAPTYWGQFHLWGDRMVLIGDHCHESLVSQCSYTALTPGHKDLKASVGSLYPRGFSKYTGVCGYAELWCRPVFVDGYLFARGVNKEKGHGAIICWDLRALPVDARVKAAQDRFEKGEKAPAVEALIGLLSDDSRHARLDACKALGKCGESALPAAPRLVGMLGEWFQPDVRAAFDTLVGLGAPAEKTVFAAVENASTDVRKQAWQILTRSTPKSAEVVLAARKAAVRDADGGARQAALECLVAHGEMGVPTLLEMVESAEERAVGFAALGMLGTKAKSALPKLVTLLGSADTNLCRYALVAATKLAPEDRLPDTAEKWLKELMLSPASFPRDARCDYMLAVRHLHRFGARNIPVFVETCTTATEKRDWPRMLWGVYGLSLYGGAAKDQLPVLEDCLKKFSNHKDYQGCIKPPLEKAMATITGDGK